MAWLSQGNRSRWYWEDQNQITFIFQSGRLAVATFVWWARCEGATHPWCVVWCLSCIWFVLTLLLPVVDLLFLWNIFIMEWWIEVTKWVRIPDLMARTNENLIVSSRFVSKWQSEMCQQQKVFQMETHDQRRQAMKRRPGDPTVIDECRRWQSFVWQMNELWPHNNPSIHHSTLTDMPTLLLQLYSGAARVRCVIIDSAGLRSTGIWHILEFVWMASRRSPISTHPTSRLCFTSVTFRMLASSSSMLMNWSQSRQSHASQCRSPVRGCAAWLVDMQIKTMFAYRRHLWWILALPIGDLQWCPCWRPRCRYCTLTELLWNIHQFTTRSKAQASGTANIRGVCVFCWSREFRSTRSSK